MSNLDRLILQKDAFLEEVRKRGLLDEIVNPAVDSYLQQAVRASQLSGVESVSRPYEAIDAYAKPRHVDELLRHLERAAIGYLPDTLLKERLPYSEAAHTIDKAMNAMAVITLRATDTMDAVGALGGGVTGYLDRIDKALDYNHAVDGVLKVAQTAVAAYGTPLETVREMGQAVRTISDSIGAVGADWIKSISFDFNLGLRDYDLARTVTPYYLGWRWYISHTYNPRL